MRALVVDDVKPNCRVIQALLAKYGDCDAAHDGMSAIEAFRRAWVKSKPYQLLILDIMMPGMNGLQLLEVIRKMEDAMHVTDEERARILMVSAIDKPDMIVKARLFGIIGYLIKPIFQADLTNHLKEARLIE